MHDLHQGEKIVEIDLLRPEEKQKPADPVEIGLLGLVRVLPLPDGACHHPLTGPPALHQNDKVNGIAGGPRGSALAFG